MNLYPAEAKKVVKEVSERGTGEKIERLYPAEAKKVVKEVSERGTGEKNRRLYPPRRNYISSARGKK